MANWARGRVTAGLMAAGLLAANLAMTGTAMAQDVLGDLPIIGKPQPGAIGFQPASSSLAHDQQWLDRFVLWIITGITIVVCLLILWCIVRFNRRARAATWLIGRAGVSSM